MMATSKTAPAELVSATIYGFFGKGTLTIPLDRRPTVLIGSNGTGKSTALSILHRLFTAQWRQLAKLPFDSLVLRTVSEEFSVERQQLEAYTHVSSYVSASQWNRRGTRITLPRSWDELSSNRKYYWPSSSPEVDALAANIYPQIRDIYSLITNDVRPTVLYYPTYRRIERDFSELFDIGDDEEGTVDIQAAARQRYSSFGEVVGFGGQDIRRLVDDFSAQIENRARQALNQHSIRFLEFTYREEEVSNREFRKTIINQEKVDRLLGRINTFAPNAIDSRAFRASIEKLQEKIKKSKGGRLSQKDDIAIFYMVRLFDVLEKVDKHAAPLHRFAHTITSYFAPRKFVTFNDQTFRLMITNADGEIVSLDALSSGEKQILSLFAFLMFSDEPRGRMLIIDEPELSLSVLWQRQLLKDLIETGRPKALLAATHSPFIFEDFDLSGVISMDEVHR